MLRGTAWLLGAGLAFMGLTFAGFVALGPFQPDEDPAPVYAVRLLWNAGEFLLVGATLLHARRYAGRGAGAVRALAGALVAWTAANAVWTWYNFAGVDVPYPALPDLGYVVFNTLIVAAMLLLFAQQRRRIEGVDLAIALVFPVTVGALFLTFLVPAPSGDPAQLLQDALNVYYPAINAAAVAVVGLLLVFARPTELSPAVRRLALALLMLAVTDALYALTTSRGLYFTGSWVDLLYVLGIAAYGWALTRFEAAPAAAARPAERKPAPVETG